MPVIFMKRCEAMSAQYGVVFSYALGIIVLFFVGRALSEPIYAVRKIIIGIIVGAVTLFIANFLGEFIGLRLPFNFFTVLAVGFLGIPGLICLIIIKFFIL